MGAKSTYTKLAEILVARDMQHVLDVGCGDGKLALALKRLKYKGTYFGVDHDEAAIKALRENGFEGECCDLRWLDFRRNTQYCVVVKDVEMDNQVLSRTIGLARRYFAISIPTERKSNAADAVRIAESGSFYPLWSTSDIVSPCPILIFERRLN